ncbi:MAG: hypothetical protein GY714_09410 [Desulfobacterales bacterium]|nr:hypothetical protein [Desulfobacterales bacterium]MCP4163408.1 hypothetical protein [Deltaproteobacteria bacterium]
MEKRTYKAININKADEERLFEKVFDKGIVIGVDVAKTDYFCNIRSFKEEHERDLVAVNTFSGLLR